MRRAGRALDALVNTLDAAPAAVVVQRDPAPLHGAIEPVLVLLVDTCAPDDSQVLASPALLALL